MPHPIANVIGFDDGPLVARQGRTVPLVGVVYARERLDGALIDTLQRDGDEATATIARLVLESRFRQHTQCVLLQGLTFAGFDVVDLRALHEALGCPVLSVARRQPDMARIRAALTRVEDGERRLARLEAAGPMEALAGVWVQRAGIDRGDAEATLRLHTRHGALPEPLRVAHLLAAAVATGHSHGGA